MATTNDLKNGMVLNLDGQLWQVIWFQHHKPGKGGAVVRSKLKNIESGKTVDKTFNADVKVEVANVDKRTMQYLYNDGTSYVFMDTGSYEQLEVSPDIVGDAKNFMLENQDAVVATNDGRVLYIELPASVELEVSSTRTGAPGRPVDDWVGTYGSAGYVLAAWNGTAADNDLISLPAGASAALEVGSRAVWATSSTDVRALDAPDESHRRLGIYHSGSALRVRLSFANGYSGTLHLYAVDWDNLGRREIGERGQWRQHPDHRHHHQLQPGRLAALPGHVSRPVAR